MLNSQKALELARRLTPVADFPTYSEAIEAVAEDLVYLTESAPDADIAEARARWVVEEIRRTWPRWSGSADFIQFYRKRFDPAPQPGNAAKDYGAKPKTQCKSCNDTGVFRPGGRDSKEPFQWCECQAGIMLHFDMPDWLEFLNPQPGTPESATSAAERWFQQHPVHPATEKELQRTPNADCPACQEKRIHKISEREQFHQEKIA